jgi:hypothetical protein
MFVPLPEDAKAPTIPYFGLFPEIEYKLTGAIALLAAVS